MIKVIHPFDTLIGMRFAPVFMEIEIKNGSKGKVLTIHGVEGPLQSGNCRGACGQIDMHMDDEYLSQVRFQKGWDREMVNSLLAIWKRWHLNDLNADCIHQRELGWAEKKIDPDKPLDTYSIFPGILDLSYSTRNAWVNIRYQDPDREPTDAVIGNSHPNGLLTAPCPVCGFKYGTAWVYEPIPNDVLRTLASFPETKRTPAWV